MTYTLRSRSFIRRCRFRSLLKYVLLIHVVIIIVIQFRYRPFQIAMQVHTSNVSYVVEKKQFISEDKLVEDIREDYPNIPVMLWLKGRQTKIRRRLNVSCAVFADVLDLQYNNNHWQTLYLSNGTFQFYGAYLDSRSRKGSRVRILGMNDQIDGNFRVYCQIWFEEIKEPAIVEVTEYKYIFEKKWLNLVKGIYQPYLLSCRVPAAYKNKTPASVSLVERPCDYASNNLRIIYDKPVAKKDFAVCVKGLDFIHKDISIQLVQWIEILQILGADKIYFYQLQVHPNIQKVLQHYQDTGFIHVTRTSLAGGQANIPILRHKYSGRHINEKRLNEVITYNDCFNKHMYQYKFIVLLDIDEIIVPVKATTWKGLMESVTPTNPQDTYPVRHIYFMEDDDAYKDIPSFMYLLQSTHRAKEFSRPHSRIKSFHNTSTVLTLHNHFPMHCLDKSACKVYRIDTEDAQLQHYISRTHLFNGRDYLVDRTLWRFKDQLIEKVTNTLKTLKLIQETL